MTLTLTASIKVIFDHFPDTEGLPLLILLSQSSYRFIFHPHLRHENSNKMNTGFFFGTGEWLWVVCASLLRLPFWAHPRVKTMGT